MAKGRTMKAVRLQSKINQLVLDNRNVVIKVSDVMHVYSHADGSLTGNVNFNGLTFHSVFNVNKGAWVYDSSRPVKHQSHRSMR